MDLVAERPKAAVGEAARVDAVSVDDVMLEWADECLREAMVAGRTEEVALYKRALDHVARVKSGERAGSLAAGRGRHGPGTTSR